jgi:uracil-DNA glycosylase family 4
MDYKCTKCDLHKTSCSGIKGENILNCIDGVGSKDSKIMIIGLTPSSAECTEGVGFSNKEGTKLKQCLSKAGINEDEVYLTYLVKCRPPRTKKSGEKLVERKPLKKEVTACKEHIDKEISEINPNVIILLGATVTEIVINKKGVTSIHGTPYWSDDYNATCIPVYSPGYLVPEKHKQLENDNFIEDLKFAKESSKTKELETKTKIPTNYIFCDTIQKVNGVLNRLKDLDEVVIDIETTGLDPRTSSLLGIALSWKEGTGVYIPFNKWFRYYDEENYDALTGDSEQVIIEYVPEGKKAKKKENAGTMCYELEEFWNSIDYAKIMKELVPAIVNKNLAKTGHNIAFDICYLNLLWNVVIEGSMYCTMLADFLPDPERFGGRSLEELTWTHTDMGGYDEGLKGERKVGFKNTNVEDLAIYGCGDVDATGRIKKAQTLTIQPFLDLLLNIAVPFSIVMREIEYNGIKVDVDRIHSLCKEYDEKIKLHEQKLLNLKDVKEFIKQYEDGQYKAIKERWCNSKVLKKKYTAEEYFRKNVKPFNYGSPIQLRELLKSIGLDTGKETDSGLMSTNEQALLGLKGKHKMLDHFLELRHLKKIYSTYLKPIPELAGTDGRLHTSYRLDRAATGRSTSSKPNLQNIPKKKNGNAIRDYFVASPGNVLIESDLKQIEYRILAHYVNDDRQIQDIVDGLDIHRLIASESYGIPEEQVTKEQRENAKSVTFGVPYGRSSYSLAAEFGMGVEEAEDFRKALLNRYPKVFKWIEATIKHAKNVKYIKTYFGRIRFLPNMDHKDTKKAEAEVRKVIATCIQGTAADVLATYMINIRRRLMEMNSKAKMVLTVHDSLFLDTPKEEVPAITAMLREEMERPIDGIRVPIATELQIGARWGSMVDYNEEAIV